MKLIHKAILAVAASSYMTVAAAANDEISAASDVGYPPFAMVGPTGAFEGYDIDVVAEISKRTNMKINIIDQAWATTFAGLNAGKFDMVVAPVMITKERAKNLLFSQAYGDGTYQFLIRKSDPQVNKPEDLKGKVLAVNKGNIFDRWLSAREDQFKWTINRYDKNSDAIQAVVSGQADAVLIYTATVGWTAKQTPMLVPSNFVINEGEVYGYAFRLGDEALRNRVDEALACMKEDGTLAKLYFKWTGLKPLAGGAVETVSPGHGQPGFEHYDSSERKPCSS